jgi:Ca-activated chloride channel family protein
VWQEQTDAAAVSTGCQGSLWARGRLRHLEDLYATRNRDLPVESLEKQMVELSMAFGVLCRFTAIVAIDPRHPDRKPEPASLRRIVQPVDMILGMKSVHAFRAPTVLHRHAPGIGMYLSIKSMHESPVDPLKDVQMHALEILARARPKSGAIGDVKPGKVRNLLKAALALLRELGACGAPRETIESLAAAYGRLYALPADRAAVAAMLDVLADIAELSSPAARWWRTLPVDAGSP